MSTPNPNHPEAVKAAKRAERAAIMNAAAKREGVRFLHSGIYTVAYRVDRKAVVELSTAICNPTDRHNAVEGRMVAFERFAHGHRITLKLANGNAGQIKSQLKMLFGEIDTIKRIYSND